MAVLLRVARLDGPEIWSRHSMKVDSDSEPKSTLTQRVQNISSFSMLFLKPATVVRVSRKDSESVPWP